MTSLESRTEMLSNNCSSVSLSRYELEELRALEDNRGLIGCSVDSFKQLSWDRSRKFKQGDLQ